MLKRKSIFTISSDTSNTSNRSNTSILSKKRKKNISEKSLQLMSFGIELQAQSSIILFSHKNEYDDTVLYFPSTFRKIKISDNPKLEFYGDAITDYDLHKDMKKLHKTYPYDTYDVQVSYKDKDKSYCVLDTKNELFNDLEIVITYPNLYNVTDMTSFLLHKVMESYKRVDDIFNRGHIKEIDSFNYNKINGRYFKKIPIESFSKFQWYDLIIPTPVEEEPVHILTKGNQIPTHFYVQITVGVKFDHLLDTFEYFKNEYKKIPIDKRNYFEDKYIDLIDRIKNELIERKSESVMKKKKIFTIYVLFIYICKTRSKPKKYPFLIRHHLTSIIKLLTDSEFKIFLSWLGYQQQFEATELRNIRHYQAFDRFGPTRSKDLDDLYKAEGCDGISSMYSLLKGKLIFLIEFRYYNNILNNYLGRDNHLLSYDDLKHIPYIQSYTRASIPIHKQIYPDVPPLLSSLFSEI